MIRSRTQNKEGATELEALTHITAKSSLTIEKH